MRKLRRASARCSLVSCVQRDVRGVFLRALPLLRQRHLQGNYFSKVLFMVVTLRRKYTRVMTFENVWQGQFHCLGCGICRVGFRENYFHCDTCVACLPLSLKGAHKCIKESLRVNCPVCLEVCVCVCRK